MMELLQSILTLTKEFGLGLVSSVGCLVLVWYMRSHIKEIGKQHNERFDKLHEMHREERDEKDKQHRIEREEEAKRHREERAMIITAFDKVSQSSDRVSQGIDNVAKALNGVELSNTTLTTFIQAKL